MAETPESKRFKLLIDDVALEPAVCQRIEVESNSEMDSTGTQCGDIRQQQTAEQPWRITVEGIVTNGEDPAMLTVHDLLYRVQEGDFISIVSDFPIERSFEVQNVLLSQETGVTTVNVPGLTSGSETAFTFQIQLGAENNE